MKAECVPVGWRVATYGGVLIEQEERAGRRLDLPVLSVTKTRGPMLASERFGKVLHSRDISRYRVARRNMIVADPMLLWDGAIGIQQVVDAGLVSPDYRVYAPVGADPDFMAHVVRSPAMLSHYQGGARGTNVRRNRIARTDFHAIPLLLPPLLEQRKIAAIVSSVDDAISRARAVIDQLQVVKKAVTSALLTRGLPGVHEFVPLHEEWRLGRIASDIAEFPKGWSLVKLAAVARLESVHTPSRRCPEYWDGDVPWISLHDSRDLDEPEINCTAQTIGPLGLANSSARLLPKGTVVFSRTATVGKSTIMGREMTTSQDFANYVCGDKIINRYLMHTLRHMKPEWDRLMAGSTHQTIYMPVFRELQILLPPVDEQIAIASIIDALEARIRSERAQLPRLTEVKSTLISALLAGEVRVTPDEATP